MFDQIKKEAAKQKVDWKELALEKINTSLDGTSLMGIQEMSIDNIRKAMELYDKDGPKSQGVRDFAEMICDGLTRARDPEGAKALFSKSLNDYLRDPEIGKPTAFRSNSSGTTALEADGCDQPVQGARNLSVGVQQHPGEAFRGPSADRQALRRRDRFGQEGVGRLREPSSGCKAEEPTLH